MKKLRILVDMDAVLADIFDSWYPMFNKNHKKQLSVDTQHNYEFFNLNKKEKEELFEYVNTPNFFYNLKPIKQAINTIKLLSNKHEIIIVTSPPIMGMNWEAIRDKTLWLTENLPFLNPIDHYLVFTKVKSLVRGDILIDDSPKNLIKFKEAGGKSFCVDYPYNRHVDADFRIFENKWNSVITEVNNLSKGK